MNKKYIVRWNRNDYGYIVIEAKSQDDARELFLSGEFDEKDLFIKNGGFDVDSVVDADNE